MLQAVRPEVQLLEANHPVAWICIHVYIHTQWKKEKRTAEGRKNRGKDRQTHRHLLGTKQNCTDPKTTLTSSSSILLWCLCYFTSPHWVFSLLQSLLITMTHIYWVLTLPGTVRGALYYLSILAKIWKVGKVIPHFTDQETETLKGS